MSFANMKNVSLHVVSDNLKLESVHMTHYHCQHQVTQTRTDLVQPCPIIRHAQIIFIIVSRV